MNKVYANKYIENAVPRFYKSCKFNFVLERKRQFLQKEQEIQIKTNNTEKNLSKKAIISGNALSTLRMFGNSFKTYVIEFRNSNREDMQIGSVKRSESSFLKDNSGN